MAEYKADALNDAYKLRVYFRPQEDSVVSRKEEREDYVEFDLPDDRVPESIAYRNDTGDYTVLVLADAHELRLRCLQRINEILDATIVNAKQREAVGKLVSGALWDETSGYVTDRPW